MPIPAVVPAIVTAAGAVNAAVVSAYHANQTNQKNIKAQKEINKLQMQQDNTAFTRSASDQRRAGLNPVVDNAQASPSSPLTAPTVQNPFEGLGSTMASVGNAVLSAFNASEMNTQNNSVEFAQKWQNDLYTDVQNIESLLEKADNDFKTSLETLDEKDKELIKQTEDEAKKISSYKKEIENNEQLKNLFKDIANHKVSYEVKDGQIYVNANSTDYGVTETETSTFGLGLHTEGGVSIGIKFGADVKSGGTASYSNQVTHQEKSNTHQEHKNEVDKTTTNGTDVSLGNEKVIDTSKSDTLSRSWEYGFEKVSKDIVISKLHEGSSHKLSAPAEQSYLQYIELRSELSARRSRSKFLLDDYRNDPTKYIKRIKFFLNTL